MAIVGLVPGGGRGIPSAVGYFSLGALWQWDRHRASQPETYETGIAPLKLEAQGQKRPEPSEDEKQPPDEPAAVGKKPDVAEPAEPSASWGWPAVEEVAVALTGVQLAWYVTSWACRRRGGPRNRGVIRRNVVPASADAAGLADRCALRRRPRVA